MVRSLPVSFFALGLSLGLAACSVGERPTGRPGTDGGVSGADGATSPGPEGPITPLDPNCTPTGAEGSADTCNDGLDNDCDYQLDCAEVACSGVGACPICGRVDTPLGSPLALPDGVGGSACTSDADCPAEQRCFTIEDGFGSSTQECRESYRSTLTFIGFGGATFDSPSDITSLCVVMEHSWIRDLEIDLEAPNGARVRLQRFLGQEGDEIYLGEADDCDDSGTPTPGTGARYCWTPTASRPAMLDYANGGGALDRVAACDPFGFGFGAEADMMPPGDYSAADDWSAFVGSPLNGDWTLSVTDLWSLDNGYIFEWSITFDANNVEDCSSPLI